MPVTQVGIANSALTKIGADRISSITENVKAARLANELWSKVRDEVLRAHPWNFAIKRSTLTPNSTTPDSEYDYTYDLPSDLLKVLSTPEDLKLDFVVEGRTILTDEPEELPIRYIYRNEDYSSWDSYFAEAFAWRLAAEMAYNLTQSLPLAQWADQMYKDTIAQARSADGSEGKIKVLIGDDWLLSRR